MNTDWFMNLCCYVFRFLLMDLDSTRALYLLPLLLALCSPHSLKEVWNIVTDLNNSLSSLEYSSPASAVLL